MFNEWIENKNLQENEQVSQIIEILLKKFVAFQS